MFSKLASVFEELEKPRAQRPFGSGWLSGSLAVLMGVLSVAGVLVLRFPATFTSPDLGPIHDLIPLRMIVNALLIGGYLFAVLSLLLSRKPTLPIAGFFLIVLAALMYGVPLETGGEALPIYFGLDFFILKVLTVGLLFLPLERLWPHRSEQTVLRTEWREDFFYFAFSTLMVQVLNYLTLAPTQVVNNSFDLASIRHYLFELPLLIQIGLIMVATDFLQYWIHYAFHKFPLLWRFHKIHHSAQKMDWIAGARMHFFEIAILRGLTALPMLTLGFSPTAVQGYLVFVYFYSAFIHANIGWKFGPLERFLVTPRFHHWHHGSEREALDINFASHFPLFDWLFGTYHLPDEERWPEDYGVRGEEMPHGYLKQFMVPFFGAKKVSAPDE
ncbi:MAG: sterol desaturase family protein [Maritimibacter sp.]